MIKNYNLFLNENNNDKYVNILNGTKWTYDILVDDVDKYYTDIKRSKEDTEYYLSTLYNLHKNGGKVYRILFHYDIKFINKDILGEHWCIDKDIISNFSGMLKDGFEEDEYEDEDGETLYYSDEYDDLKSYMIIATIPPNFIKLNDSIGQFSSLPNEFEVNLIDNPQNIKIEENHI